MKTITVEIDLVGQPKIEANGFTDASCKEATRPIEEALSGGTEDIRYEDKPEAHIPASGSHHIGLGY